MQKPTKKQALKSFLGLQIQPKDYILRRKSFSNSQPITASIKSIHSRKSSISGFDGLKPARVRQLEKPLKIQGHQGKSSALHRDFCESLSKNFPVAEINSPNPKNFRVTFKKKQQEIQSFDKKILEEEDTFISQNDDNQSRVKSLLEPFSHVKLSVQESSRKRFSTFLKGTLEFHKDDDPPENYLNPQSNPFDEKLRILEKNIQIEEIEHQNLRRAFREFLTDSKSFLKPSNLKDAYERDIEIHNIENSKSRLGEVKPGLRKYLLALNYNSKKRKYQCKVKTDILLVSKVNRVRLAIRNWLVFLDKNETKPAESMRNLIVYPKKPFSSKGSYFFLRCLKQNKFFIIRELLLENPKLLMDFDFFLRSPLHWVCDLGLIDIMDLLSENPKFLRLNMKDIQGKTPLYLACKAGFKEIVRKMLFLGASPWSDGECKYNEESIGKEIFGEIRKARKIEIMMKLAGVLRRKANIWRLERQIFLE